VASTYLTPTIITRKALAVLHNKLTFIKTINRQYDAQFAKAGGKIGSTLKIRMPNQFTVRTGMVMNTQDITEESKDLVVATVKGIDMNFGSQDLTLTIDDFSTRYIEPAMARLAGGIESDVLANVYKDVYWLTGTPATTPASLLAVLNAGARLSQSLAPVPDRHLLFDSISMAPTVNSIGTYFHKSSELERAFMEAYIGMAAGFKWWESNMVPNHTNGSRDDTTPVCNTSTGITSGSASIVTTGADGTMKAGDIFTIADVFAVNEETKQRYSHLQQFAMLTDFTNDATDTWTVTPTPFTSGPKQNVELVSAGAGKAIVNVAAGGSGAANAVIPQPLAYHRDAFTFVTADLENPKGTDIAAREVYDGISISYVRDFDITNRDFPCRLDVLYGFKTLRPQWAVRVRG
jgi:hypothetical protein